MDYKESLINLCWVFATKLKLPNFGFSESLGFGNHYKGGGLVDYI